MPATNEDLGILANILALPRTLPAAQQQAVGQRALYQPLVDSGVLTPEQLQTIAPDAAFGGHFPGSDVPVLGGFLRGTGTVGQLMQTVLGSGGSAPAPRPPIAEIGAIAQLQENARSRRAKMGAADSFTNPQAKALAEAGEFGAAAKIEHPTKAAGSLYERDPAAWERQQRLAQGIRDEGKAPGDPKSEFQLYQKDPAAWEVLQQKKNALAGDKAGTTTQAREDVKATVLTSATKTMVEAAPKISHFIDRIEKDLGDVETGPFASRYQEFMAGKIGAPNPAFTRYRTNVGLMMTLLLRMHVGARGGQQMLEHFKGLVDSGVQSPENMRAALGEIRAYAQDVATRPPVGAPPGAPTDEPVPAGAGAGTHDLGDGFTVEFTR